MPLATLPPPVTSVKGTANQISATPSTGLGDVVLSFANGVQGTATAAVVLATSPTITTPTLSAAAFGSTFGLGNGTDTIKSFGQVYGYASATGVASAMSGEITLGTFTLNKFDGSTGQVLMGRATGVYAANGNNKSLKWYWGSGTTVIRISAANANAWEILFQVWRSGSNTQQWIIQHRQWVSGATYANLGATQLANGQGAETDSSPIVVKITSSAAATANSDETLYTYDALLGNY